MSEQEGSGQDEVREQSERTRMRQSDWGAEKYRNDPVAGIVVACALIWAGIAWILSNAGAFGPGVDAWPVVLAGAGVIVILGAIVRLFIPKYRRPIGGGLVLGFALVGAGLGQLLGWEIIGPLVLIAIAISIIVTVVTRKR